MIFWLTLTFLVSQVFAGVALVSDIVSFQVKERKKIIIFFLISASCIAIHYILLDRYLAATLLGIGVIRFIIAYYRTDIYWMYIFISLYLFATLFLYKDAYDLIVLLGMSLSTIASFQSHDKPLRQIMMSATSCSILYNTLIFSPVGVLLEVVFLMSNFVWYWRHYIVKKK